jgi:hypothetical protein
MIPFRSMIRRALAVSLLLLTAPAWAADKAERPRLVLGAEAPAAGDKRVELYAANGISLGAVSGTATLQPLSFAAPGTNPGKAGDRLALGGYAGYAADAFRLGSSFRNDGAYSLADLSAAYDTSVFGMMGTTALTVGAGFTRNQEFSLTPHTGNDLSVSLSWTREVTPSLSFGTMAGTSRPLSSSDSQPSPTRNFTVGAGLGLKF